MGSLFKEIKHTQNCLNKIIEAVENSPLRNDINHLEVSIEKLLQKEETHWKIRSRNNWLAEGDRITAYFHKTATERRKRNNILNLKNANSIITPDQKEMDDIVTNFYSSLVTTQSPT